MYDDDMRMIQLSEVVVTAPRIERKNEARLRYGLNHLSDITLRREEFDKSMPMYVTDLLRRVAGVVVYASGNIQIRQGSTFGGSGQPLVIINGTPVAWPERLNSIHDSPLETVNVDEVESIDVFKSVSATIFGSQGFNGVISITTRRGGDDNSSEREIFNQTVYTPLGYQKPVEFYSPKYETLEAKHLTNPDYRTTIFWKPDIIVSEEREATFDFYTSDFPTTYSVVIEGLTIDGQPIRQIEKIRVE